MTGSRVVYGIFLRQNAAVLIWLRSWQRTGELLAAASIVLIIAMQAAAGEWLPPPVSISQYGVGPWGWIFSLFVLSLASSPVCAERALAGYGRGGRTARALLLIGLAGTVVMAVVRTQPGGAQTTLNAKVHMIGSILTMGCMPLGMLALLWTLGSGWRWTGVALTAAIECSLGLLLFAAAGYDTADLDPPESWAFWQAIATILCIVMVVSLVSATHQNLGRRMSDHTSAPVTRAGRGS